MPRQIVVEIVGDASKFSKATNEAITQSSTLGSKLSNLGKGAAMGAGIASFNLLSDAVGNAIGQLGAAHDAYLADQAGQALLAQAMQNSIPGWDGNTAAVEAYASAQRRLGFADDDVRISIGQLVGVTHDLTAAQDLNSLAQDLARAKEIDLATATDIVTKAHEGNGKALKGLGIDIGGAKTAAELLDAIQRNVTGSAETWAGTNTGKLAVSNVKVGEAMEKVGKIVDRVSQVVIPLLADAFSNAVEWFDKVWDAAQPVIKTVSEALTPALQFVTDSVIPGLLDAFKGIAGVISGVFDVVTGVIRAAINLVIDGVNAVFGIINAAPSLDVGDIHVSLPKMAMIPRMHTGGIVPGPVGADVLTLLQGGERVIPAGVSGPPAGMHLNVTIAGPAIFDPYGAAAQQIAQALLPGLRRELSRQGMSLS